MDAPVEIERRYLVNQALMTRGSWPVGWEHSTLQQGYLHVNPWLRVRIADSRGYLTVKGEGTVSRVECEMEIPRAFAEVFLESCPKVLFKTRYTASIDGLTWVVDCYAGPLRGLWTAEVELPAVDTPFVVPEWAVKEVTADKRYSASELANATVVPADYWADAKVKEIR